MKKKLSALFTLLVFCVMFLSGCNLFVTDTEKDLAQVVATVGDETYQDEITKLDLLTVFLNNNGLSYVQQGMAIDDVMEMFYQSLVNRRIQVQEAVKALAAKKGETVDENTLKSYLDEDYIKEKYGKDVKVSDRLRELLADESITGAPSSIDENTPEDQVELYNKKYRLYHTAFNAALSSEESQIKTKIDALKLQDDEDYQAPEETEKTKRPKRDDNAKVKAVEQDPFRYRAADGTKIGEVEYEGEAYSKEDQDYIREAYRDYVSEIRTSNLFKKGEKDPYYITSYFEMMLIEQLESQLIEEHSRLLEEEMLHDEANQQELLSILKEYYLRAQKSQEQEFIMSPEANISKIEGISDSTYLLYNNAKGQYGFVKHILVKFDYAASLQVELINNSDHGTEWKRNKRNELALQLLAKDYSEDEENPVKTDVSTFMAAFNTAFGGEEISGVNNGYENSFNGGKIYRATAYPDYVSVGENGELAKKGTPTSDFAKIDDKFIDWEYAYSDDVASITSATDMLLAGQADPFLSGQKYVADFSEAARQVIQLSANRYSTEPDAMNCGYYTAVVTDFGIHIIMCTDVVRPGAVPFNEGLALEVIADEKADGSELTERDKKSAEYKIFTAIKSNFIDENYTERTEQMYKDYESGKDGRILEKNDKLYQEVIDYVMG